MNTHHFRFVLRQWIEHQNPANLRLHVWVNGAAWLGLTTVLSQVPVPVAVPLLGPSLGAWFVALSVLYWLPADPLTAVMVGLFTLGWAHLPVTLWGPASGWLLGAAIPLAVFVAAGLAALFAHIYYHEHASFFGESPAGEPRSRRRTPSSGVRSTSGWRRSFAAAGGRLCGTSSTRPSAPPSWGARTSLGRTGPAT